MSRKRTYDQTFRMEAVSLVNTSNKSIAAVARELDIPPQTLTRCVSMYGIEGLDAFVGSGNLSSEKQEERFTETNQRFRRGEQNTKKGYAHLCQRPEVIFGFIQAHRHEFRVSKMCEVLGVSKSGFYQWLKHAPTPQQERKAQLKRQIKKIHKQSKARYGSPKITRMLWKEGTVVSERTVSRLMKEMGIRSKVVKKYKATTNSKHNLPIYPNLVDQDFKVNARGIIWVSDITYVHTDEGWLYLATVMDLFSRRIIGWAMSKRMTKHLVIRALKRAFQTQPPTAGLIHHSDRGSQYAALEYQALLESEGIITSMSRKGNCYDNACIESFHSIIKKELIHHERYKTRSEATMSILEYIMSFYNYERIHGYLNYLSPMAFEKMYA